jgi:rod shape-determining protein MreD
MLRFGRLALYLVLIVLLQTTVLPYGRVFDDVPDVGLVATVAVAYREGSEVGATFGFFAGLAIDFFLQTPLGLSALAFALTGYLIGLLQGALLRSAWWVPPVLGALGGILGGALFVGIGAIVGQDQLWALRSVRIVLLAAAFDALVAFVIFPITALVTRRDGPRTAGSLGGPGW